jgi:hypothetical protein
MRLVDEGLSFSSFEIDGGKLEVEVLAYIFDLSPDHT